MHVKWLDTKKGKIAAVCRDTVGGYDHSCITRRLEFVASGHAL